MSKRKLLNPLEIMSYDQKNQRHQIDGFTLIELLVVIAIIAILMAILIPVLRKAREQTKSVRCFNNMRQIGLAANMYADDYDLYIPRGAAGMNGKAWYQLFMPFLAQKPIGKDYSTVKIYRCPSYPNHEQTVCYVVNAWTFRNRNDMVGMETTQPTKLTDCRRRAETVYLADNEDGAWRSIIRSANDPDTDRCDVWSSQHLPNSASRDVTNGRRVARARHRFGCNCLYLDWHVEYIAAKDMTVDMWRFEK